MTAKPTYQSKECPLCAEHVNGHCDDCHVKIPNFDNASSTEHVYRWMAGNGFKSQTSTHNHFRSVNGIQGMSVVSRELCKHCYLIDFAVQYPDASLPFQPSANAAT